MQFLGLLHRVFRKLSEVTEQVQQPVGNKLTVLDDDAFLVSYPRSGNTWMRFLLGQAKLNQPLDLESIESVIPDIYIHSNSELLSVPRPRVMKSHEMYDNRYPKVIYLVRDPRDVAISFYFWRKKKRFFEERGLNVSLTTYLHQFVEKEIAFFAAWDEHVQSWMTQKSLLGDTLLIMRYEDIEQSPKEALRRAVKFLDWEIPDTKLDFAVKHSVADRMRRVVEASWPSSADRKDIPFVREARSAQWREVFDDTLKDMYTNKFGKWMEMFGYEKE